MKYITKRDGTKEEYKFEKIENAIRKAFAGTSENSEENIQNVLGYFKNHFLSLKNVEEIQDAVEKSLINKKMYLTSKAYILYRKQRENARSANSKLTKTFNDLLFKDAEDFDLKRENANQNGNAPMGLMLFFGSETEKEYVKRHLISEKFAYEHDNGDFHIHDLNMYACTFNCCNIGLKNLLKYGFSTGHGTIREPQSISSALALTAIIIQANQNDMFGGQGIPLFDYELCPYLVKSFAKHLKQCIEISLGIEITDNKINNFLDELFETEGSVLDNLGKVKSYIYDLTKEKTDFIVNKAVKLLDKETKQGMQAFIHNLNTMQSRCLPKDEQVVCLNIKRFSDFEKLSDIEKDAVKDLLNKLYIENSIMEISSELSISKRVLTKIFNALNIKIRDKKESWQFVKNRNLKTIGVPSKICLNEYKEKIKNTQFEKFGCYAFNTGKQLETKREKYSQNPEEFENVKKN